MSGRQTPRRPYTAEIIMARLQGEDLTEAPANGGALNALGRGGDNGEVLAAIAALRKDLIGRLGPGTPDGQPSAPSAPVAPAQPAVSDQGNDELKQQLSELSAAIEAAKADIRSMRDPNAASTDDVRTATRELDAVVQATETATNDIMEAAEQIDDLAIRLCSQVSTSTDKALAEEINERVVNIFEACNFQDVTGQRITKVVNTLEFIDDRVSKMMALWGAEQAKGDPAQNVATTDADLLHGPSLEGDGASQDDIDAMFD